MFRSSFRFIVCTLPVLLFNLPAIVLGALSCTGLVSTLCTVFYAPVGMLLRGGKTVENANFCQILTFIYSFFFFFCTLKMFLTFPYLFSCRCRSDDVYVGFSLDLVCSRCYGMRFSQMF